MWCLLLLPLAVLGANDYRNEPALTAFVGGICKCPDGQTYSVSRGAPAGSYCGPLACEGGMADDYCHIINNVTGCAAGKRATCDGCNWTVVNDTDITDAGTDIQFGPTDGDGLILAQTQCVYHAKNGRCKAVVCDASGLCNLKNTVTQVAAPGKTAYIPNAACYQRKNFADQNQAECIKMGNAIPRSIYTTFVTDVQMNGTSTNFTVAKVNQIINVSVSWSFVPNQTPCPGCFYQAFLGPYRDQTVPPLCHDLNRQGFQFTQTKTLTFSDWGCHFVGILLYAQNTCSDTPRPVMGEPVASIYIPPPSLAPTTVAPTTPTTVAPTAPTTVAPTAPTTSVTSGAAKALILAGPCLIVSALL
jgi:hypothetical protein